MNIFNQPNQEEHKTAKENIIDFIKLLIITLLIVIPFRLFIAQPFSVSGSSMIETFQDKDYLIVDEISYSFNSPERGEVIVFKNRATGGKTYIKRIIGLPGETIEIKDNKVTIFNEQNLSGITIDEPYIQGLTNGNYKITLESDEFFVLGDNRENSRDSRIIGPIKESDIIGRAFLRLWPFSSINYLPGNFNF